DVGLDRDQVQEPGHGLLGIDQALVHVDVEDLGTAGHLLAGDLDRLVEAVVLDQLLEPGAAGDVGALADVDEVQLRRDHQRLEAGQAGVALQAHAATSSTRGSVRGGSPATAPAMARMCSGVVPQQPPLLLTRPDCANAPSTAAISAGVSSYSPKAFGRPALGWALTWQSAMSARART